jgi:hypothetical protein
MATYVYETIPRNPGETPLRFEFQQSMKDPPLSRHPETGQAMKRIVSGGFGIMNAVGKTAPASKAAPAPCSAGCACHRGPRLPES